MVSQYDVRAVSLDLDGCCFPKNKLPEQPDLLAAYLKTQEGLDSVINLGAYLTRHPPLTFAINTGRSWAASYPVVQVMGGDGNMIVAVEHGHGIRMPGEEKPRGIDEIDRTYEPEMKDLREIRDALYKDPEIEAHKIEKDFFVAIRVPKDAGIADFREMVFDRLGPRREMVESRYGNIIVVYSHGAIDIRLRDITKATALRTISKNIRIPSENWLAIEDTDKAVLVDEIPLYPLKIVEYAGCPADSSEDVKHVIWEVYKGLSMKGGVRLDVPNSWFSPSRGTGYSAHQDGYIATQENGRGTLEILKHFLGD